MMTRVTFSGEPHHIDAQSPSMSSVGGQAFGTAMTRATITGNRAERQPDFVLGRMLNCVNPRPIGDYPIQSQKVMSLGQDTGPAPCS
jgi:hypothetical protein